MKPKPNNDWLAALEEHSRASSEQPGKEWKSRTQLEAELNRGHTTIDRLIASLSKKGLVERKSFMIERNGKMLSIPHYKLLK